MQSMSVELADCGMTGASAAARASDRSSCHHQPVESSCTITTEDGYKEAGSESPSSAGISNHIDSLLTLRRINATWMVVAAGALVLFLILNHAAFDSKVWRASSTTGSVHSFNNNSVRDVIRPKLHFRHIAENRSVFKIIQIADIHLGEAENLDWGPEQDRKTWNVLDKLLTMENDADLIVLSGDQLTGNNCKDNATAYYRQLGDFLTTYGKPWAIVFGNHDDLGYMDPETEEVSPPKYTRPDLLHEDQRFHLSLSKEGPIEVFGTSNYILNVSDDEHTDNVSAQIYFFDSGGGSLPEQIHQSQLDWLRKHQGESTVPAVAFQHIPTESFSFSDYCTGFKGQDISPLPNDAGIIQALLESERFLFLAVGHYHGNDYCCSVPHVSPTAITNLKVCFGRHSGYGGYGKWERGIRVYELTKFSGLADWFVWKTWVRLESGKIVDEAR
eukprot:scaffold22558_cov116-Cylindrotheca_fusiformis.AAC.9